MYCFGELPAIWVPALWNTWWNHFLKQIKSCISEAAHKLNKVQFYGHNAAKIFCRMNAQFQGIDSTDRLKKLNCICSMLFAVLKS